VASLHPDLEDYADREGVWHPLVYTPGNPDDFPDALVETVNAAYEARKAAAEKALADADWHSYLFIHERPFRLELLLEIEGGLSDEEYWRLLGEVYTDSENIHQMRDLWAVALASPRGSRDHFMPPADRARFRELPDQVKVFRGFAGEGGEAGWSWSTDSARAAWYARRSALMRAGTAPYLASAVVGRDDNVAIMGERGEAEVILSPAASPSVAIERLTPLDGE
jgi:hypothetical protein